MTTMKNENSKSICLFSWHKLWLLRTVITPVLSLRHRSVLQHSVHSVSVCRDPELSSSTWTTHHDQTQSCQSDQSLNHFTETVHLPQDQLQWLAVQLARCPPLSSVCCCRFRPHERDTSRSELIIKNQTFAWTSEHDRTHTDAEVSAFSRHIII